MKTVAVTAAGRNLGKTTVVCGMIRELCSYGYSVSALKMRPMDIEVMSVSEGPGRPGSDTHRFAETGASFEALVDFPDPSLLPSLLESLLPDTDLLLVEGGSAARVLAPDILIYIDGNADNPRHRDLALTAQIRFPGPPDTDRVTRVSRLVPAMLDPDSYFPFRINVKHWISLCGTPVMGEGIAGLLRAVESTGSLIGASRETGIPYKRAWVLLSEAEERLGARLLTRRRGGSGGGGSGLTPLAGRLLGSWEEAGARISAVLPGETE